MTRRRAFSSRSQCAHCGERRWIHARGICRPCFRVPEIKALYQPADSSRRSDVGLRPGSGTLPPFATEAPPGSIEKVDVLIQRARDGYALWHPNDAIEPDIDRLWSFPLKLEESCPPTPSSRARRRVGA